MSKKNLSYFRDDVCWTEEQLEAAKQKVSENATEKVDAALRGLSLSSLMDE